jgi:predicted Rossmann fold nucleotide-binding protein DprA/Smf involved in DNA uptake
MSYGTNLLIKDGATPITCAADILENYKYLYRESLDFSALARVGVRSELKAGALSAYGVEEGDESTPVKKTGAVSALLHSKKRVDGATVSLMAESSDYPQFEAPPKLRQMSEEEKKSQRENSDFAKLLESLDEKYLKIYNEMPTGESVSIDKVCRAGYDPRTAMSLLTTLEMKGLVRVLPGGLYQKITCND